MTDGEVRMVIYVAAGVGLPDLWTLCELMQEEGVQVVSATKPRPRYYPAAPRRPPGVARWQWRTSTSTPSRPTPFMIDLQGAEPAIDAALARFRQRSDAWVETLPPVRL